MNAVDHGLYAESPLLPGENEAAWEALRSDLFQCWLPANGREFLLFEEVVNLSWRLLRLRRVETRMWSKHILALREREGANPQPPDAAACHNALAGVLCEVPDENFRNYFRQERAITRDFYRATRELERVQAERHRSGAPAGQPPAVSEIGIGFVPLPHTAEAKMESLPRATSPCPRSHSSISTATPTTRCSTEPAKSSA